MENVEQSQLVVMKQFLLAMTINIAGLYAHSCIAMDKYINDYPKVVIALGKTGQTQAVLCDVCWVLPRYEPNAKQVLCALFTLGLHGSLWEVAGDTRFTRQGIGNVFV